MKILLMGANGFLGRHVGAYLESRGHAVRRADIAPDPGGPDCLLLDREQPDFPALLGAQPIEACVNCSGAASVPQSFAEPMWDFTLNTVRVAQMLEGLRRHAPGARFVHLSSAAVYGNPVASPVAEDAAAQPVSPYGWHKHLAERICEEYFRLHGVQTLSLRIFSAYGPGLRKQLFWDVFQKARAGERVELFGTGDETRDFIFVRDVAACLEILLSKASFDGRAVNVASGVALTVRDAAQALLDALGWRRQLCFSGDPRAGDPCFWRADISYARGHGFAPAYSLAAGLREVADWMLQA